MVENLSESTGVPASLHLDHGTDLGVIEQCLQKEPAARPQSMKEVVRTLEQDWASDLLRAGRRPRKE